jgi:dihydromethanopterin reductase (acceptor)
MNIAWAISGAGHYLEETFSEMEEVAKDHKVTVFLSKSGEEVVRAYGLLDRLKRISPGGYLQEVFTASEEGSSAPSTGRFFLKRYDALIVAPATTNTVAKIVYGISDTLVTNAVSHAMKSMTPVYILPVDTVVKEATTKLPYYIDKALCRLCSKCPPAEACKEGAISGYRIDLLRCTACGICEEFCEYGAIVGGKKVKMRARQVDVENVNKLKKMEYITVLKHPEEIRELPSQLG